MAQTGQTDSEKKETVRAVLKAVTDKGTNYRLKNTAVVGLLFFATVADIVTLIPIAGDIVAPVFWVLVSIYLYFKGHGILNARRLATSLISMATELIPVIQEFPLLIVGIAVVIVLSRLEDKTGIKASVPGNAPLNQGGIRRADTESVNHAAGRQPLNVGGVRQPTQHFGDNS